MCIVWCLGVWVALNFCHQGTKTPNPTKNNIVPQRYSTGTLLHLFNNTKMRVRLVLLCLGLWPCISFSQGYSPSEDIRFARYLIENNQHRDAIYVLRNQLGQSKKIDPAVSDSLDYFLGLSYFNLKDLDSSYLYFHRVSAGVFYPKSAFYCAFNKSFLKRTGDAKYLLDSIRVGNDSMLLALCNFEFAGLALLERDYPKYEEHSKKFSGQYFSLADEEKKSTEHYAGLKKVKKKYPLLAATMSAVLPGSGKFYAGFKGQGIAAFMTVAVLGISAAESYYRLGPQSAQFIAFGGLFTIFYIGNIWGSTISVKLARDHQFREIDDQILFDMYIPLRRIFN